MKINIIEIICTLYFIACIGAEIWYLLTNHKIGDYDTKSDIYFMIYLDSM
ncbi:hypothetical protein C1645_826260 [Glomus cerebriforme]|uniref:Uncharacterized protein n=1 Tax=Glomus cerebriforme TaxID=658196 RepID=A0A397SS27_9GLOM|nr:hypothetical protein C1645_826260 [Glomus cerebriforme]